jgi:hypothetical protein
MTTRANDMGRCLAAFDQDSTLTAVVEMGCSSWLIAGLIPGIERQPKKKIESNGEDLLRLLGRWRAEAVKAGRPWSRAWSIVWGPAVGSAATTPLRPRRGSRGLWQE